MLRIFNRYIFNKRLDMSNVIFADKDEQLNKFNILWSKASKEIALYRDWMKNYQLPEKLESLDELENFPILKRSDLRLAMKNKGFRAGGVEIRTTGGSTGEPISLYVEKKSINRDFVNIYTSRKIQGIDISGRLLLIWGHSHLFGTGWIGVKNQIVRKIKDSLRLIKRVSAYQLSTENVAELVSHLQNRKYEYIVGYASSIRLVTGYCIFHNIDLSRMAISRVIITSETIFKSDVDDINKVFGCNPIIEYGMAEFGVIASGSFGRLKVFTADYHVYSKEKKLLITDLNSKIFPLINYDSGDYADQYMINNDCFLGDIIGRSPEKINIPLSNSMFAISDETRLQHFTKNIEGVVQVKFKNIDDKLLIRAVTYLDKERLRIEFLRNIKQQYDVASHRIDVEIIKKIPRTLAGKVKL